MFGLINIRDIHDNDIDLHTETHTHTREKRTYTNAGGEKV